MSLVKTKVAMERLGVCAGTLRNWDRQGLIRTVRSPKGQRLYDLSSVQSGRLKIAYARVSSKNQSADLENQVQFLKTRYPNHEIVTDIGSGLNFKRKGLISILDRALSGAVEEIVVSSKDRLCRFGFDLVQSIANKYNTKLVVLEQSSFSPQEELVRDLISIVHVFSCRVYGLRKYSNKIKKDQDLPKERISVEV